MAIEAAIEELSIADLLQLLSLTQKTGILRLAGRRGEELGEVYLKDGNVAFASRRGGERIADRLLKEGRISDERLASAEEASREGLSLEEALVQLGFVTQSELDSLLRTQVQESVYHLFEVRKGHFRFEERPLPSELHPVFSLKVETLIIEGSRRVDEWSRMTESIPSLDVVLALASSPEGPGQLDLKPREWTVLSLVDGKRTVRDIAAHAGSVFDTAKTIYELISAGVLEVAGAAEQVKDHKAGGEEALSRGLYEKAVEEFELALEDNPDDPCVLLSLGEALYRKRSYREAASVYDRLKDRRPEVHYHMGLCLARLGELKSAISEWETSLTLPSSERSSEAKRMIELAKQLDSALEEM